MVDFANTQETMCNLALGHFAGRSIVTITENSPEAEACRTYFGTALAFVLSDHDWKFASRVKPLVQGTLDDADLDGWQFAYVYPTDAAKVREILTNNQVQNIDSFGFGNAAGAAFGLPDTRNNYTLSPNMRHTNSARLGFGDQTAPEIPFNVSTVGDAKYVFTDVDDARARYTFAPTSFLAYPPDFSMMFSYYLAHLIVYRITRKLELKASLLKDYLSMKAEVQANNINEGNPPKEDPPAPWIRARHGY